jgi:hypothetical protein
VTRARSELIAPLFVVISFMLFVASLTQDAFYIDKADNPRAWSSGFGLLLVGWMAVLDGVWAWLANPALAVTWLLMCLRRTRVALGFAFAALGLSLSFLRHSQILSDEGGGHSRITGYSVGYWLWIASISMTVGGCLAAIVFSPGATNAPGSQQRESPT